MTEPVDVVAETKHRFNYILDCDHHPHSPYGELKPMLQRLFDEVERLQTENSEANSLIEQVFDTLNSASDDGYGGSLDGIYLSDADLKQITAPLRAYLNPQTGEQQ